MKGYFDYNTSVPVSASMRKMLAEWLDSDPAFLGSGNSPLPPAWLERAHTTVSGTPGLEEYKLVFTSGATESNRLAFEFLYHRYMGSGLTDSSFLRNKVLISSIEHSSVYDQAKYLRNLGYDVLLIPCSKSGVLDMDFVEDNAGPDTALISVMYASGETGVVQPVRSVADICERHGIHFHCDASQIPLRYSPSWHSLRAHTIAFSGHKLGALSGVGMLLYRQKEPVSVFFGDSHTPRPGAANRLGIQSLEESWKCVHQDAGRKLTSLQTLRNLFEKELLSRIPEIKILGKDQVRLVNTSSILLPNTVPHQTTAAIQKHGFQVRALHGEGGMHTHSRTLLEMGVADSHSSAFSVSFGETRFQ